MKFRKLKSSEVDCRISTVKEKGFSILLYKDARCDMNILDETVGCFGWQRKHTRDNHNCIVSIYDKENSTWVEKEDAGTESFTEKEKGLASDSFKRACFNWGIGRELYTAPFIWINANQGEVFTKGNGYSTYAKMEVSDIGYDDDGNINSLKIVDKNNNVRFEMGKTKTSHAPEERNAAKKKAISDASKCKTIDELNKCWNLHASYKSDVDFINAVKAKKETLK